MIPIKRHIPRPIRFVELWSHGNWNIKLYCITEHHDQVDKAYIRRAKELTTEVLGGISKGDHHGVAFVTIHVASMFNQIIVDWWARENELRHMVFKANPDTPLDFQNITSSGEAFCVWELRVIAFERDAWMKYVLNTDAPALDQYLAARLSEIS